MSRVSRLGLVFALNAALISGLVVVGLTSRSIGVLAAAGDYVADAVGIATALLTVRLARRAPTPRRTFGLHRSTILAAQLNSALIIAITALVGFEAIHRIVQGTPRVDAVPVIAVSTLAALVMLVGAIVLRGERSADLNSARPYCSIPVPMPSPRVASRSAKQ